MYVMYIQCYVCISEALCYALWLYVCSVSQFQSSFQGIVISDGLSTFAVIIFGCEHVTQLSGIFGFNAAEEFFENHEYTSVYLLTCHDADPNEFTNIVFTLGLTGNTLALLYMYQKFWFCVVFQT